MTFRTTLPLAKMDKLSLIKALSLQLHPVEGGYFSRTYTSDLSITEDDSKIRPILSSIFYLLTDDSPIGYLHRNRSDIVHYYHAGLPLEYIFIGPDGQLQKQVLGLDLQQGHKLQLTVKGGYWKASRLLRRDWVSENGVNQGLNTELNYGLVSEAVSPGFLYADMEIATADLIRRLYPKRWHDCAPYIKPPAD